MFVLVQLRSPERIQNTHKKKDNAVLSRSRATFSCVQIGSFKISFRTFLSLLWHFDVVVVISARKNQSKREESRRARVGRGNENQFETWMTRKKNQRRLEWSSCVCLLFIQSQMQIQHSTSQLSSSLLRPHSILPSCWSGWGKKLRIFEIRKCVVPLKHWNLTFLWSSQAKLGKLRPWNEMLSQVDGASLSLSLTRFHV